MCLERQGPACAPGLGIPATAAEVLGHQHGHAFLDLLLAAWR